MFGIMNVYEMHEQFPTKKIETNKNKHERPIDELFSLTGEISHAINEDTRNRYHTTCDLVDSRGTLSMDFFSRAQGGVYTQEEIKNDKETILAKEIEWSGAHDQNVQEFYKKYKGIEGKEQIARAHIAEKERNKSSQMEMLTNAILYKVLKDRFIVMRASTFDDYFGGVDNYLVDKETGDIVCAFDEVHDHAQGDRKEEKWKRVESIGDGGRKIKYGIVPQGDKLVQKELRNIPVFFLSLTTEDLERGMNGFSRNIQDSPNELEKKIFNTYTLLLEEEYERVKDKQMPRATRENLEKFRRALNTMKLISKNNAH